MYCRNSVPNWLSNICFVASALPKQYAEGIEVVLKRLDRFWCSKMLHPNWARPSAHVYDLSLHAGPKESLKVQNLTQSLLNGGMSLNIC